MQKLPLVFLSVISFYFTQLSQAQNIFVNNDASLVIGLESAVPMNGNTFTNSAMHGIVIEKPLGQFSVGVNLQYSSATAFTGYKFSGYQYTNPEPAVGLSSRTNIGVQKVRIYDRYEAALGYLNYGAELKYRMPCNCFFAYANVKKAEVVAASEETRSSYRTNDILEYDGFPPSNLSIGYGFGVNLPISKMLRGVFKFGKEYTNLRVPQYQSSYHSEDQKNGYSAFLISFGLQYGIKSKKD